MVKIEQKKGNLILYFGDLKLEWTVEPRYWRNPLLFVGGLLLLPLIFKSSPSMLTFIASANLYACIAIPLAWQITGIGRLNFGPQLFIGVGGFTAAILSIKLGWGPLQTLPLCIFAGIISGLVISPITTIAKGLYFSLITLLLPLIFLEITYVFTDVFKGETGLSGITQIVNLGSVKLNYLVGCYLSLVLMLFFLYIVDKVLRSRIGLFAATINDDEEVAQNLGLQINKWKIACFVITSTMIAVSGWFIAHYYGTFAGVTYLPLSYAIKILLIVMVGGRGAIYGSVVGAYFVLGLEHFLAPLGSIHYVIVPIILLILLGTLPEGIYGIYRRHKYREYYPKIKVRKQRMV